ncbi:hypothetical protein ACV56Z_13550 [Staphylococcus aureus]
MVYPHDHEDERESRFANERYHARYENDGTFSVYTSNAWRCKELQTN